MPWCPAGGLMLPVRMKEPGLVILKTEVASPGAVVWFSGMRGSISSSDLKVIPGASGGVARRAACIGAQENPETAGRAALRRAEGHEPVQHFHVRIIAETVGGVGPDMAA